MNNIINLTRKQLYTKHSIKKDVDKTVNLSSSTEIQILETNKTQTEFIKSIKNNEEEEELENKK